MNQFVQRVANYIANVSPLIIIISLCEYDICIFSGSSLMIMTLFAVCPAHIDIDVDIRHAMILNIT